MFQVMWLLLTNQRALLQHSITTQKFVYDIGSLFYNGGPGWSQELWSAYMVHITLKAIGCCILGILGDFVFPNFWSNEALNVKGLLKLATWTKNTTQHQNHIATFWWPPAGASVTRKKSPNVYKSCPKMILTRKMKDFDTFTKICLRMWEIWAK